MNELPILPEPLASVAKQDLQPSNVRRLTPQFLGQVNYYQNRFDRLEALTPQLNPFRVLSNINSLITDDLNSCRENSENLSQEIKNARHQLNKINIQLEQNLENLKTQRSQVKTEIKELLDQLVEQLNEKTRLAADIHGQILITKEQVETSKSEGKFKLETVIKLWQEIRESSQLLPQLHTFFNNCLQNPDLGTADASQLSLLVQTYENQIAQIENLVPELNPFPVLSKIKSKIEVNLQQQQKITAEAFKQLQNSQDQLDEIKVQLQQQIDDIKEKRYWWQEYWQTIPEYLEPEEEFTDLFELNFLRRFKVQFEVWQQELGVTTAYLNRYQNLISDWIEELKNPSEQNRQELRKIYLDNANVIGITCNQSAKKDFSQEFKYFDVVIIDEVSKCTPPELLIPALKAKKLVLVGDHRQLPPMLNDDTIEEIAEELGTTTEELNYLKESIFKKLFESAPESIKKMLTIQYRMHPQIMVAINQFYENNLECGLTNPDKQRLHDLDNSYLKNNNHIVWVKTPQQSEFREQNNETSPTNEKEIEIIENNILEDFIFRAGVELNPPATEDELATVLGLDPIFIKNTTATLRNSHTLEKATESVIKLTPVGQEFYDKFSIPEDSETKTIYAISQLFANNPGVQSSSLKNQETNHLPNLKDFITIDNNIKSVSSLLLSDLQELIQNSNLGFHSPENGKFVTSFKVEDITEIIWQSLSLILIFDVLEDNFRIQAREGKKVLKDASTWLNNLLDKDKTLLKTLFDFTDKKNGKEGTNNFKLQLGIKRLSKAGNDPDLLCLALLSLHGALEDYFRHWLASNSSVPLSKREAFNFSKIQWKGLLDLMQQYGGLNEEQKNRIREMNELRKPVGHGEQYTGKRSQLEKYADFVQGFIVNGT